MRMIKLALAFLATLCAPQLAAQVRHPVGIVSGAYDPARLLTDSHQARRHVYVNSPQVTLPLASQIGLMVDPDTIAQADGTEVTSYTDSTNSVTCTAPVGNALVLKTAQSTANGHNLLRSTATYGVAGKFLNCGRPTGLLTPMSTAYGWSAMVVFRNPTGADSNYATLLGDILNRSGGKGFELSATVNYVHEDTHGACCSEKAYSPGDPATNIHTYIYSGDAAFDSTNTTGRLFLDGTMWFGTHPLFQSGNAADPLLIGSGISSTGTFSTANAIYNFTGDIVFVAIWKTPLTAAQAWQADAWARVTYGKPLGTIGLPRFIVQDGDSQVMGTGANSDGTANTLNFADASMPWKVARARNLILGQYGNVGKPSAQMATGTGGGNNLTDSAPRDVDQWHAITGLPIVLVWGEFHNQAGFAGGVTSQGVTWANSNRAYAALRKAADPTVKMVMWTSTSSYDRDGGVGSAREGFNNSMVTNPGRVDYVVPVHLDPNIGIFGAVTVSTPSPYFADGRHLNGALGTSAHRDFLLPYIPISAVDTRDIIKMMYPANDNDPAERLAA